MTLWLPDVWPLQKHRHPWGRTYREGKLARYENMIISARITLPIQWLIKEQVFSKPRVLPTVFLI